MRLLLNSFSLVPLLVGICAEMDDTLRTHKETKVSVKETMSELGFTFEACRF